MYTSEKYPRVNSTLRWKTLFILGRSSNAQWEAEVTREEKEFGDILQGDFVDSEYEGTRKFLLGMTWLAKQIKTTNCQPRFVMKTEEHIYHNMNSIMSWLQAKFSDDNENIDVSEIYMGKKLTKDLPIREAANPLYVSWQVYERTYFPDMIQGPQFLFSFEAYSRLAEQRPFIARIAMEEGYIALLAERAKIQPIHNDRFVLLKQPSNVCHTLRMMFLSDVKPSEHKKIWKDTKEALTNGKCLNAHVVERRGNKRVNIEM